MARGWGLALLIGLVTALVTSCGEGADPTPTISPDVRTATAEAQAVTATAAAETVLQRWPPCVLDVSTARWCSSCRTRSGRVGTQVGQEGPSLGLRFYEASIAYGLLDECREVDAVPVVSGSPEDRIAATPSITCPPDLEAMDELRGALEKGVPIMLQLIMMGVEAEDLEMLTAVNGLILQRIDKLEIACSLRNPATPAPAATLVPPW